MFKARVAGVAMLGYVYLFTVAAVLVAATAVLAWTALVYGGTYLMLKLAIPLVLLIGIVAQALWVTIPPPKGQQVRPGEAPALFAEIERVRAAMGAPRMFRVLLTEDHNAGVAQHPRWGVLGGYQTYLLLGLPLMASLSPDEFRAVLAHEFGHAFRAHGRVSTWIYRVQHTWIELMKELDLEKHWGQRLFSRFFHWYVPYFGTHVSVLSRIHEFEADRLAESVSPGFGGPALVRVELSARYLGREFWPGVASRTRTDPEPPNGVFQAMVARVPAAAADPRAAEWLAEAMARETEPGSSHPALRERLAALGYEPGPLAPVETSAAQALLGARLGFATEQFSQQWQMGARYHWQAEHQKAQQIAATLEALEARAAEAELSPAESSQRIFLTAQLHGQEVAVPMARAFLDAQHEDAFVHFLLGRALAEQDDEAALPHLERAVALDEESVIPACMIAADLLHRLGRPHEAAAYQTRAADQERRIARAAEERSAEALSPKDTFLPHGLDEAALDGMRAHLAGFAVKRVYLVRKRVEHFPEQPLFVLALETDWGNDEGANHADRMRRVLQGVQLPGGVIVVRMDGWRSRYRKPVRAVPGSEVFNRARRVAARP